MTRKVLYYRTYSITLVGSPAPNRKSAAYYVHDEKNILKAQGWGVTAAKAKKAAIAEINRIMAELLSRPSEDRRSSLFDDFEEQV